MRMKQLFSLATAFTVILSSTIPALANAPTVTTVAAKEQTDENQLSEKNVKITRDAAMEIAMKALKDNLGIEIDDKAFQTEATLREDFRLNEKYLWDMAWNKNENGGSINLQVGIDAEKGTIVHLYNHYYKQNDNPPVIAAITGEQAKALADDFIRKMNPEAFDQLKYMENPLTKSTYVSTGSPNYNFLYTRLVNKIPYLRDSISVEIDGITAKPVSYECLWDEDLSFPDPNDAVTTEKAQEIFNSETDMKLTYIPVRDPQDYTRSINSIKLVYTPSYATGDILDAKTGKMLDSNGQSKNEQKIRDLTPEQKEALVQKASTAGETTEELDSNKAETFINTLLNEFFGNNYQTQGIEYRDTSASARPKQEKVWVASFRQKDGKSGYYDGGSIEINASTGKLLSLHKYSSRTPLTQSNTSPTITWEEAYDKAIEIIGKYFADQLQNIRTEQTYTQYTAVSDGIVIPATEYHFNFPKIVNGILYTYNYIDIAIDAQTGKISRVNYQWDDNSKFPSAENVISKEEALKNLFESYAPELSYNVVGNYYHNAERFVSLIYQLKSPYSYYSSLAYFDAFTGKQLTYEGTDLVSGTDDFQQKIKGHWAENQLQILATQNIINTSDFQLEKEITLIDFLKMIVKATSYQYDTGSETNALKFTNISKEDSDYTTLLTAAGLGLIQNTETEFDKAGKITRQDMAEILMKLLGYDALANAKGIFTLPYEDANEVNPDKLGYVALGTGLEIFSGSDGKFHPNDNTSMVDAAVTVYKALSKLRNINN